MSVKEHLEIPRDAALLMDECVEKLMKEGVPIEDAKKCVQENFYRINFDNREILNSENLCRR